MKKLLFVIILFITTTFYSQDFIPMFEDGNVWNIVTIDFMYGYTTNHTYSVGDEYEYNGEVYTNLFGNLGNRYVREENGIVYQYDNNSEFIVLDFNLSIGEFFENYWYFMGDSYYNRLLVENKYEEFIAGESRIVLVLQPYIDDEPAYGKNGEEREYWIEGIGSTNALLPFDMGIDGGRFLTCFTDSEGITTYFNDYEECIILSTEEYFLDSILLTPNPITNSATLKLPLEAAIDQLIVYDISGKQIFNKEVTTETIVLNNNDFISGIYFYQVVSNGKPIKTEQFIVK